MAKIVLATIGSLGDLHPFIAIGLALKARGHRTVLAVPLDHAAKVEAAGLEAVIVLPSFAEIAAGLDGSDEAIVQRVMRDPGFLVDKILVPGVSPSAHALEAEIEGAALIAGSVFMFAAPIVAEKHGVPLVDVVLQPMSLLSAYDPPRTDEFRMMKHAPVGPVGAAWNRLIYAGARQVLRRRYAGAIDAVRIEFGLKPSPRAMLLDPGGDPVLTLCCYSPLFAPLPQDAPANAVATGFAMFDSESGAPEALDPALAAFLDAGPAPLVFTLGSFAVYAPGDFYATAAQVARKLGRRAVLLVGERGEPGADGDIFACRYAPHSALFPRAAAIVHHGGAGTTGQALRSGKPQLVVAHMGDQYDNAQRIQAMGVGLRLDARGFTAARAESAIRRLDAMAAEAERIGAVIRQEHGAEAAANAIEALL